MRFLNKSVGNPFNIIAFLAIIQVFCATYFLRIESFHAVNSILFLLCGLGISFFLLRVPSLSVSRLTLVHKQQLPKLFLLLILLPVSYFLSARIMDNTPLQKEYADMLPVMKVMGTRFINGTWNMVYEPIPEIWGGTRPIYLPAMWMPFTAALALDFDMRWITVCGIWLSVFLCVVPGKWKFSPLHTFYAISILVLLAWLHFDNMNNVIRLTEEGVVFFYYTLMVVAIISGKPWLVGVAAALCLLSRYAMIGWIPFAGLYLLFTHQYKYLLTAVGTVAAVILILLILPFGFGPLLYHWQLPSEYIAHAERIWNENPDYFYRSLGMARFFGPGNVKLLHSVLVWGTFLVPVVFFIFLKKKTIPANIALLSCFQLCITFFYNFLDVSYLYLYYTPVFVSLCIAGWVLTARKTAT